MRLHWWQRPQPRQSADEPTVWVDPSLVVESPPPRRMASGTTPPPTLIGAYCALEPSETEGIPIFIDELLRRYF